MPDQLTQRVLNTIATTQRINPEIVKVESSFQELGIDSMDGINILFALENEFDITIPDEQAKQIRSVSEDVLQVETGSLYPALHRLEAQGLIASEWDISEKGKRAKYYQLTRSGRKQLVTAQPGGAMPRLTL